MIYSLTNLTKSKLLNVLDTKYNDNYGRRSIRRNLPFHKLSKDELQKCFNMSAPQFFRSVIYTKLRRLEIETSLKSL